MSTDRVEQVANAILYEGYLLYPYRASSRKNQVRFTLGRLYPEASSACKEGSEPFFMQTQALIRSGSRAGGLTVRVRFLQPIARDIVQFASPVAALDSVPQGALESVPALRVGDQLYQAWQESAARDVRLEWEPRSAPSHARHFEFPDSETLEAIVDANGRIVGAIRRRQAALNGTVALVAEAIQSDLLRLTVRVENHTPAPEQVRCDPDALLLRTFASAHTILQATEGEFVSLLEPRPEDAAAAGACRNVGTWPVLVGDKAKGQRDTLLSSPIILYDYPEVAPESPGDLFDGTEIDEILSLRIQTLTEQERWEARQVDDFARQVLERTDALSPEQMSALHGRLRPVESLDNEIFGAHPSPKEVCVNGVRLGLGDRVRIRPKGRADVMDLVLEGKAAVIEAIEQDAEARVHLALVVEEDPGQDLGVLRQPGHRFFYGLEEVEPIREERRAGTPGLQGAP